MSTNRLDLTDTFGLYYIPVVMEGRGDPSYILCDVLDNELANASKANGTYTPLARTS